MVALLGGARDTGTVSASAPATVLAGGRLQAAVRLGWIVTMRDPVPAADRAVACVRAGAACDLTGMLAADSAHLQTRALVDDLRTAIDPASPGYDPLPTDAIERARRVVALGERAGLALGDWLSSGCGSHIDGMPVEVRPEDCGERSAAALGALAELRSALSAWPR